MSVYVTGDTHGSIDISKLNSNNFSEGKNLTKEDIVIILGDFGLIWDVNESRREEQYWLDWLSNKPWTTCFVDGNHCNFDRIYKLEQVKKFGSTVGKVNDSIFHLKRGHIYNIHGKRFFTFGGGTSIDKFRRKEFISWWKEEIPSDREFDECLSTLESVEKVDFILTHAAPESLLDRIFPMQHYKKEANCPVERFLDIIIDKIEYNHHYFGHYHEDKQVNDKSTVVYRNIIKIIS